MKGNKKITMTACLIVAVVVGAVALYSEMFRTPVFAQKTVQLGSMSIAVDIARDDVAHERGLSGRTSLDQKNGMLFLFDRPGVYSFWMKEMNFPIDIVWIDSHGKIVGVDESVVPATYPKLFYPSTPVQYVLEVSSGTFVLSGARVGDMMQL